MYFILKNKLNILFGWTNILTYRWKYLQLFGFVMHVALLTNMKIHTKWVTTPCGRKSVNFCKIILNILFNFVDKLNF